MAGTTVGDETQYVELGNEDMGRVGSNNTGLVRSSQVLQEGHQRFKNDIDGGDADFEQSRTGDKDDFVLRKVLAGGASSVWELWKEVNTVSA